MAEPFISQITGFGLNFVVRGWAFCNGAILPIESNTALFSLIGCTYGGDCRTTMALPDMRGRISFQHGSGPGLPSYPIGSRGGATSHTMTANQTASHFHNTQTMGVAAVPATTIAPASTEVLAVPVTSSGNVTAFTPSSSADTTISTTGGRTADAGGNQSFSIQNPYLSISYEIALLGIFPSRN